MANRPGARGVHNIGEKAQTFVKSAYPLGARSGKFRPWDHCVSEATFKDELAKGVLKKRR